jgi:class 3 adenylate cyclase
MANDTVRCPSCGASSAAAFRFCPSCGVARAAGEADVVPPQRDSLPHGDQPVPRAPDAPLTLPEIGRPLAERRLVSVLFLDLVGFTALSESLDPEDVREIQWRYFESARATVSRYGGSLEKFIGDAVMAVWGTPVAHEDDAERAVRTALEVVADVAEMFATPGGRHLQARGAVTTGEAAVTLNAEGQGMVTGDLVNTASRLQEAAAAGTVLVDDTTRHVVGMAVRFEGAGDKTLKGKVAAVAAWRAVEAADRRADGDSAAGHRGPFVGRQPQLHQLRELLASVVAERRGHVVSLSGIAGIGKSRLAWELERVVTQGSPSVAWYAGRAPGYGEGIAFAPLAEMVRRSAGIAERDPLEVARRSLLGRLVRTVPDEGERGWMQPALLALLEPGSATGVDREEVFAAWRRFFEAEADATTTVLLFEDLQWADPALIDFIEYLGTWSRHHPLLVLTLSRPELLDTRPTWGAGLPHFTAMHLDRLSDRAIDELVTALAPGLEPDLAARVRARADGVPLYAVEMARMLIERGARPGLSEADEARRPNAQVEIPESLHALISARIDALPAEERALLLTAAVLGRRFPPDALAAVAPAGAGSFEDRVAQLVRREFLAVDDEPRSPGRGQLSFVQELVREIGYHTLSRRERRALHLAVAAHLQGLGSHDVAEPLAEHLLAAHAAAGMDEANDEALVARARDALRQAAARASSMHAPHRAHAHLVNALQLTEDPQARADLAEEAGLAAQGAALFGAGEVHLRDAIRLRESLDDLVGATRHRAQLARLLLQAQRSDTALAELEAAWTAASAGDGPPVPPELPAELARAHMLRGDLPEAIEWAERAVAASEGDGLSDGRSVGIDARITFGTARAYQGAQEEAMALLQQAATDAEAAGLPAIQLRALNNLAWVAVTDSPRDTLAIARRGLEIANRLGNREWAPQLLDIATIVAIETGDWGWALAALEEASESELPSSYRLDFAATRAIIGAFRGVGGQQILQGLGTFEPDLDPQTRWWVDHARAVNAMLADDLSTALELAQACAQNTTGFEHFRSLVLAGRVAAWLGQADIAAEALRELEATGTWGRAAEAARQTLRAAVAGVELTGRRGGAAAWKRAEWGWTRALESWRSLELPLWEGLLLVDRWRLRGRQEDRLAATRIFDGLGAARSAALGAARTRSVSRRRPGPAGPPRSTKARGG